jgi:subtilisin family serine protease
MSADGEPSSAQVDSLGKGSQWVQLRLSPSQARRWDAKAIRANAQVLEVQPNYRVRLLTDYRVSDPAERARVLKAIADDGDGDDGDHSGQQAPAPAPAAKPALPTTGSGGSGPDPLVDKQWGMKDIGTAAAQKLGKGDGMVVAVIDTGVDYTHEDLVDNLWRNAGEMGLDASGKDKSSNGIDDDNNGFIDDVIGWDFTAANDNKPYDIAVPPAQLLSGGGNPGHGTHCAGNVAARADNGKGISGVAPGAKIMALRFMNEKGEGDTAGAVKAINYAVQNGAKVLSNSWGSEGEDSADGAQNKALRDAIQAAQDKNVLFIAAAGNGHNGTGYDNDSDPKPAYPASYAIDNIVSVAALDVNDNLGAFSNTVGSNYSDTVIDMYGIHATWDGTSMACPHVAGAAALYWSAHPTANWRDVKNALLRSAKAIPALQGKSVSGGKLNAEALMAM